MGCRMGRNALRCASTGLILPDLCEQLARLREQLDWSFVALASWAKKVSELTKLSPQGADLAKQRLASEPLIGLNSEESVAALEGELSRRGLFLQKGGRFILRPRRQK